MKRLLPLLSLLLLCAGCAPRQEEYSFFSMDTYCSITLAAPAETVTALEQVCFQLDRLLAPENSELSRLNQAADGTPRPVSPELMALLLEGEALSEETGGLCDITAGALTQAWGFSTGEYRLPPQEEIDEALAVWGQVVLDGDACTVTLPRGGALALGAFAKGMAADRCAALAREAGVTSALFQLGGSIAALGSRPDGAAWRVAVRDPRGELDQWTGILALSDAMVATSGGYERFFEQDGVTYHHILDPRTGYPGETDLLSVTVVAAQGGQADAFSTALFLLGEEAALARVEADPALEAVLVTADGRVVVTAGLRDRFTFTGGDYGYTLEQRG